MAAPETLKKPVTGEELFRMGDIGRCELVEGEIIHMSPAGGRHGKIANWIATLLTNHIRTNRLGEVFAAETGFYVRRNPDTVRAPDAMFVSNERVAQIGNPVKYLDVSPDLAVEVLSPEDTWSAVETKVEEFLEAGVRLVWVVDPERQVVVTYNSLGERSTLSGDKQLTGNDVLPGFSVPVSLVFE